MWGQSSRQPMRGALSSPSRGQSRGVLPSGSQGPGTSILVTARAGARRHGRTVGGRNLGRPRVTCAVVSTKVLSGRLVPATTTPTALTAASGDFATAHTEDRENPQKSKAPTPAQPGARGALGPPFRAAALKPSTIRLSVGATEERGAVAGSATGAVRTVGLFVVLGKVFLGVSWEMLNL